MGIFFADKTVHDLTAVDKLSCFFLTRRIFGLYENDCWILFACLHSSIHSTYICDTCICWAVCEVL